MFQDASSHEAESSDIPLTLYTIGHGNITPEEFLELLRQHQITMVVDVRSAPYSGYVPYFNKEKLEAYLQNQGIGYRFAGEYLGGRPDVPEVYKDGQLPPPDVNREKFLKLVDYKAVMRQDWYQKGLRRLIQIMQAETTQRGGRVAVMCSEIHPQECHRHHLITRSLIDSLVRVPDLPAVQVQHILKDGTLETPVESDFDEGPQQMTLF